MKHALAILLFAGSLFAGSLFAGEPGALTLKDFTNASGGAPGVGWSEENGVIALSGKGAGILLSKEEYTDFELEWEWKLAEGGNNGVKYWVTRIGGKEWLGIEYQMIDDGRHPDGLRGGSHATASIYDLKAAAKDKVLKPVGEWNSSRVVAKNGVIEHYLNGRLVSTVDTKSEEWKECVAKSKFRSKVGFAPGHGKIMLTEHGNPTWFRNIRIRVLP